MGILYSNVPLTKETPKETILQMFVTKQGTLSVKDVTFETYHNSYALHRDISFVKQGNEYIIKLNSLTKNNDFVLGLFISEGYDFDFNSKQEPIFLMKKYNVDFNLKKYFNENKDFKEVVVGIFTKGTVVSYKINGIAYKSILTEKGWSVTSNESVSDVAQKSNGLFYEPTKEEIEYYIKKAEELVSKGEISKDLFKRYKILRLGYNTKEKLHLNTITKEELEILKDKGLK